MIFQLTTGDTFMGVGLLAVVQWLVSNWIAKRLEKSIQHEYDKKLEDYRFQQLRRQKAEVIACLFSRWIKYRGNEGEYLEKDELINYYEELNRMSLEMCLWINDEKILVDIMSRLQNKVDAKDIRTLIGQIRKIVFDTNDNFDINEIVIWPPEEVAKNLFSK